MTFYLGIDTGGTYTDAVLWSEATGVAAKAKALTTRHDLAVGIAGAVDAVLLTAARRSQGDQARLDVDDARHQRAGRGTGRPRRAGDDRLCRGRPCPRRPGGGARHRPGGVLPRRPRCPRQCAPRSTSPRWRRRCRSLAPRVSGFAVCAYFADAQPGARTRRPRPDPRTDRPAGHRQPRAVGKARRAAPGADDAAQRPADLDDRPAGRGDGRISRSSAASPRR